MLRSRSDLPTVLQGSAPESAPRSAGRSVILSDEQVEELLQEAGTRLKHASDLTTQVAEGSGEQDVIAVGSVGKRKPYPYMCISHLNRMNANNLKIAKAH